MKQNLLILFTSLFLLSNVALHKDRIERPQEYKFVFKNKETIILKTPNDSLLQSYTDAILGGKKQVIEAELSFKTGEKLSFKGNGKDWTQIFIVYKNDTVSVPLNTVKKIQDIHLETVALLWGESDKEALESGYFYLRFDIGTVKSFNKYDELHLNFANKKLAVSEILRQIDDKTQQYLAF